MNSFLVFLFISGTLATIDVTWTTLLGNSTLDAGESVHLDPSDNPGGRYLHTMKADNLGNAWLYGE